MIHVLFIYTHYLLKTKVMGSFHLLIAFEYFIHICCCLRILPLHVGSIGVLCLLFVRDFAT